MSNQSDLAPQSSYLRHRLEQLAHFVHNPGAYEILSEGGIHPARALIIRAVLATPGLPKFLYEMTNVAQYRRAGFDVLGVGYHAVTVSDGAEKVRKFYRRTAEMSEPQQEAQIDTWNAKQALTMSHLGEYAVPQAFTIEAHPLDPHQSIVVATQERIVSKGSINIFDSVILTDGARQFLAKSQTMPSRGATAAVPDLIGLDNAVVEASTGAIKLIDPIALVHDDPTDVDGYHRVVRHLDRHTSLSPQSS